MTSDRLFMDTAYVQALLNRRDQHHEQARRLSAKTRDAREVWTTEAVLIEIGNALSAVDRNAAVAFIRQAYKTPNIRIASVDTTLLLRGLDLYAARPDKDWGLVDCISFIVMQEQALFDALTSDAHYRQAGFRPLMREE